MQVLLWGSTFLQDCLMNSDRLTQLNNLLCSIGYPDSGSFSTLAASVCPGFRIAGQRNVVRLEGGFRRLDKGV